MAITKQLQWWNQNKYKIRERIIKNFNLPRDWKGMK